MSAEGDRTCPRCKGSGWYAVAFGDGRCALCGGAGITTADERAWRRSWREVDAEVSAAMRRGPKATNTPAVRALVSSYLGFVAGLVPELRDGPDWARLAEAYALPPLPEPDALA